MCKRSVPLKNRDCHAGGVILSSSSFVWLVLCADVFVLGYFTVAGAGKYSVDEQLLGGEINLYKSGLEKVGIDLDAEFQNPFLTEKEQARRKKSGRFY